MPNAAISANLKEDIMKRRRSPVPFARGDSLLSTKSFDAGEPLSEEEEEDVGTPETARPSKVTKDLAELTASDTKHWSERMQTSRHPWFEPKRDDANLSNNMSGAQMLQAARSKVRNQREMDDLWEDTNNIDEPGSWNKSYISPNLHNEVTRKSNRNSNRF